VVELPGRFSLSYQDLKVRTLAGWGGLNCDRSFGVPVLKQCEIHLLVLAAQDTLPVLLGLCLPGFETGEIGRALDPAAADRLVGIVGSAEIGVRLSPATTALTLTMLNPIVAGGTPQERFWFACEAVAHSEFDDLVDEIAEALTLSPAGYLSAGTSARTYARASRIAADIIGGIPCGGGCHVFGLGPYVDDAPGDDVALRNAAYVHYGVRVMDAVADTQRTRLLLDRRTEGNLIQPDPPARLNYSLGDVCSDIHFFKGIAGADWQSLLDVGHPAGAGLPSMLRWKLLNAYQGTRKRSFVHFSAKRWR
jgi:hypothetical protein